MRGQSETNHQKDDLPQTWKFTSCIFPTLPPFQCPLERDRPEEGVLLETGRRTYRLEDISGYQESPTHPFCMSMWGRDHEMSVPKQSGYMWADPFRPCHEYEASSLSAFPSVPLEFSWHRCASDVAAYVSKLEARRNQGDTSETSDSRSARDPKSTVCRGTSFRAIYFWFHFVFQKYVCAKLCERLGRLQPVENILR